MQYPVVSVSDVTQVQGESKHQLSSKAVLHQVPDAETSLFRVKPGGRIKSHYHQKVWDLFFGVQGDGVVHYTEDGEARTAPLRTGSFCAMPPNVVHEVRNASETDDMLFLLIHSPWEGYDHVPVRAED
ncbi:cupin domain-containing protein [Aquabacter spiritensis]|uniref:Mannose-6-phosphate isomerase-like protein (Cupin superfamily) n=1 Tax=Aquabacter spiritensis TaxID=933073 RepID=A0A4R3M0Z2_9HYPH|nr:cupin domain-containing protein [Aquabacter spiritensis]TCT06761.1 mannose-6-phosphate isomerase-like protein (cupin superfamily) [Aquabacter spiritensis]